MKSRIFAFAFVFLLVARNGFAQTQTESAEGLQQEMDQLKNDFDSLKKQYGDRLAALEAKMAAMQSRAAGVQSLVLTTAAAAPAEPQVPQQQPPQIPPAVENVPAQNPGQSVQGSSVGNAKVFNPDIAVIGDFLAAAGSNKVSPDPALEMHESEVAFQAIVDPYARADFFISFGEGGVDLEEGYLTFPAIPGGLLVKAGKMRAAFGKVNTLHNHVLPWTDRPLVTRNLVGGEDGIDDAGFSVARLIPNPWIFLEATGQVFRGDSSDVFKSSKRGDLSYVGHLRGYQDITESTNIDIGISYSRVHNGSGIVDDRDLGQFRTTLYGTDATVRWRPLRRSIYHSFVGRSEFVWSRRGQPNGIQSALGYYFSGDYQFARRCFAVIRYDLSKRTDDALLTDKGQSAVLTYWPSEFSQLRGQYRRTQYANGPTANEL